MLSATLGEFAPARTAAVQIQALLYFSQTLVSEESHMAGENDKKDRSDSGSARDLESINDSGALSGSILKLFQDSKDKDLGVQRAGDSSVLSRKLEGEDKLGRLDLNGSDKTASGSFLDSILSKALPNQKTAPEQSQAAKPFPSPFPLPEYKPEPWPKSVPAPAAEQQVKKPTPAPEQQKPVPAPEQKEKPFEQPNKTVDLSKPFTDISQVEASRLLNTPVGKDLPPIAEQFEQDALKQLGPEAKPTIYVSKTATDKGIPPGARSYRTISDAVKNATDGSVIQVLAGEYNERVNLGEKNSNITIQTDRNNPAVLNRGGFRVGSNAHDITIRNFEIKNFGSFDAGIRVDGSNIRNITIAGNNIHSASDSEGIGVYGRAGKPATNINVIGNRIHDLKLSQLEALPINGNVDGFKVIGNSGYRLNNLFIDVIGGEGNGGNKDQARNGTIAFNFADGISSKNNPSYGDYSAGGLYVDGGKDLEIYGNYVRNSDMGIEIGSEHRGLNSSGVNVHNNIFERSVLAWLKLGYKGGVDNSTIKDNLVVVNGVSNVEREGPVSPSTKVENNIGARDRSSITRIPTLMLGHTDASKQKTPSLPPFYIPAIPGR